nr:hypothetical protein CFP56_20930 [Quercus suber]
MELYTVARLKSSGSAKSVRAYRTLDSRRIITAVISGLVAHSALTDDLDDRLIVRIHCVAGYKTIHVFRGPRVQGLGNKDSKVGNSELHHSQSFQIDLHPTRIARVYDHSDERTSN